MVGANFHLVVSDLILESDDYLRFYQGRLRQGDFVILDSPAFETGAQADIEDTLHAVVALQPSEVVLPDDINSGDETYEASRDTYMALEDIHYRGRVMVVPHGTTAPDFVRNASLLVSIAPTSKVTIGLQEEIPELFGFNRQEMIRRINAEFNEDLTFHLLGVDENLQDQYTQGARSCDTAKFVVWGLNGFSLKKDETFYPPYPGRKSVGGRTGYFQYDTDDVESIQAAQWNVNEWRDQ
jgi:hypothetical protein